MLLPRSRIASTNQIIAQSDNLRLCNETMALRGELTGLNYIWPGHNSHKTIIGARSRRPFIFQKICVSYFSRIILVNMHIERWKVYLYEVDNILIIAFNIAHLKSVLKQDSKNSTTGDIFEYMQLLTCNWLSFSEVAVAVWLLYEVINFRLLYLWRSLI